MTCENGRCDRKYGYCSCPAGYYGVKCDQICSRFSYGRNCRHVCNCEEEYSDGCEPKVPIYLLHFKFTNIDSPEIIRETHQNKKN